MDDYSLHEIDTGASIEQDRSDRGSYVPPIREIRGIRLRSLDWFDWDDEMTLDRNKEVYLVKDHETVLIGRAPQIQRGSSSSRTRNLPDNSWVLPCPVLSRSHALITLKKEEILICDAGSHHGVWRPYYGTMKKIQSNLPVVDGDIFTMGKQVEKHKKVHHPARVQIQFIYADEPLSADEHSTAIGPNHSPKHMSNRYGLDSADDMDMEVEYQDDYSDDPDAYDDPPYQYDPPHYTRGPDYPELEYPSSSGSGSDHLPGSIQSIPRHRTPPWRVSDPTYYSTHVGELSPLIAPDAPNRRRTRDAGDYYGFDHQTESQPSESSYVPMAKVKGLNPTSLASLLIDVDEARGRQQLEASYNERRSPSLQPAPTQSGPIGLGLFDNLPALHYPTIPHVDDEEQDMEASDPEEDESSADSPSESHSSEEEYSPVHLTEKLPTANLEVGPEPPVSSHQATIPDVTLAPQEDVVSVSVQAVESEPYIPYFPVVIPENWGVRPNVEESMAITSGEEPHAPIAPVSSDSGMPTSRKRSIDEVEASEDTQLPAIPAVPDLATAQTTLPSSPILIPTSSDPIVMDPIVVVVPPTSTAATKPDLPSPSKRIRIEVVVPSAAGLIASAVAGSILTFAGLAYL